MTEKRLAVYLCPDHGEAGRAVLIFARVGEQVVPVRPVPAYRPCPVCGRRVGCELRTIGPPDGARRGEDV